MYLHILHILLSDATSTEHGKSGLHHEDQGTLRVQSTKEKMRNNSRCGRHARVLCTVEFSVQNDFHESLTQSGIEAPTQRKELLQRLPKGSRKSLLCRWEIQETKGRSTWPRFHDVIGNARCSFQCRFFGGNLEARRYPLTGRGKVWSAPPNWAGNWILVWSRRNEGYRHRSWSMGKRVTKIS